jgi:2-dehydro-3-deoxyglucarate aldolase
MTQATPYQSFPNSFKQDLRDGKTLIGCWSSLANPFTTEILGLAGFDWLLLDGEHSPNDLNSFILQLMALKDSPSAPVVRPQSNDTVQIKRLLDAGFYNFLVPFVESAEEARAPSPRPAMRRKACAACRCRCAATASAPSPTITRSATSTSRWRCRSRAARRSPTSRAICAVDGVDCVFIGPSDLAAGYGYLGNATIRKCRKRCSSVFAAAKAAGVPVGILAPVEATRAATSRWAPPWWPWAATRACSAPPPRRCATSTHS